MASRRDVREDLRGGALPLAADHEGQVLESFVTKLRNRKAALKRFRRSLRRHGRPAVLVTDPLGSYGSAIKDLGRGDDREMGRWANNRAEIRFADFRFAPAVSTTRASHAAVPADAKLAEICLGPQPRQPVTRPLQQIKFQAEPCHRTGRVALPSGFLKSGGAGQTEASSYWSDSPQQLPETPAPQP